MVKLSSWKGIAAMAACLLVFSCQKTPKVTELSVSTKSVSFTAEAGEETVTVTSNEAWTVTCPADWITVSPASGTENGSFKISAKANETFEVRSADVTVTAKDKSQLIKVNQLSLSPSLEVNPFSLEVKHEGETVEVKVVSNAPWTVTLPEGCNWMIASPTEGTGNGTFTLTILKNMEREARTATVSVKETIGGSTQEVSVSQEMGPQSRYTDSLALVAIYNAAGGANWKEDRVWDLSKPINEWYNIKVNEEGRVTQLYLGNGTISAEWTLPAAIGELTELTNFRIINCKLTGDLPEEVYNLTKLVSFYLTNNTPKWSLSSKIAGMTDLKDLYIDQNPNLSGTLPKELGQLKKLANFNVSQTAISGEIPAEMSGCSALENLMAYKTQISGIPDNFDQWPSLKLIQMYSNPNLTGALPASVGKCTKLTSVWFYECNFTGNVPESWSGFPATMKQLRIQDNKLSGTVPDAVKAHANWSKWDAEKYIFPQQEGYGLQ